MVQKDFYCVEIVPTHKGHEFRFEIFLSKNSLKKPNSFVVTSPEFREFLLKSESGSKFRKLLDNKSKRTLTGSIRGRLVLGAKSFVAYDSFFPFDKLAYNTTQKYVMFEDLFRGKNIGTLIEARLFKYLKNTFSPKNKLTVYYGIGGILRPRRMQLKKIRGVSVVHSPGELHADFEKFKSYLKRKSLERNGVVDWKKRAQVTKRNRLKVNKG